MNRLSFRFPESALPEVSRLGELKSLLVLVFVFMASTQLFWRYGFSDMAWLLIYVIVSIHMVIHHKQFIPSVHSSWLVLLLPLVTLLSTFWSADPGRSLYASVQLLYTTLLAIWIGSAYAPRQIFQALFLATGIGVLGSVINDFMEFVPAYAQADYIGAERYFVGIYGHKNVLGQVIHLLAVSLIVVGFQIGKPLLAMILAALLWFPLSAAQSVTSMLMFMCTLTLPLVWWVAGKKQIRLIAALLGWIVFLAVVFVAFAVDIDFAGRGLEKLGRDSTLTGRTYIWSIGWQSFLEHPLLGVGYQAFWQPGLFEGSREIRNSLQESINGFHSAYFEVLVATGVFGVFLFVAVLARTMWRCLAWFNREPSVEALGGIFIVMSAIILTSVEVVMFRQHEIFYLLTVSFFVASYRGARLAERRQGEDVPEGGNLASHRR